MIKTTDIDYTRVVGSTVEQGGIHINVEVVLKDGTVHEVSDRYETDGVSKDYWVEEVNEGLELNRECMMDEMKDTLLLNGFTNEDILNFSYLQLTK